MYDTSPCFEYRKVLHEIIESIATELLNYYFTASINAKLSQKQAFQVLFDIKYSTLLMVSRENKALSELSTKACDSVLSKIDPFDYDVFDPFVHTNVKKSVQRSLASVRMIRKRTSLSKISILIWIPAFYS